MNTALMNRCMHITSLSSFRSTGHNIPVAVGFHRGSEMVAYPAAGLISKPVQTTTDGSCAEVLLYSLHDDKCFSASGHNEEVLALAFSKTPISPPISPSQAAASMSPPSSFSRALLLCSASSSSILLWDVNELCQGVSCSPIVLGEDSECGEDEAVHSIHFSPYGLHVAVCKGNNTLVYDIKKCVLDTTLVGHTARVLHAIFTSTNPFTIATLSEDRTFKIWNLDNSSLVYQSHIVSSSPFLCGAADVGGQRLITGTADGMLRVFDLKPGGGFKCLLKSDVVKDLEKWRLHVEGTSDCTQARGEVISSFPSGVHYGASGSEASRPTGSVEVKSGSHILGLFYITAACNDADGAAAESSIGELLKTSSFLLVVIQLALLRFSGHTLELLDVVNLIEPLLPVCVAEDFSWRQVPVMGSCDLVHTTTFDSGDKGEEEELKVHRAVFVSGALFTNIVSVMQLKLTTRHMQESKLLSVLSNQPLLPSSYLRSEFNLKSTPAIGTSRDGKGTRGRGHDRMQFAGQRPLKTDRPCRAPLVNKPLTFKTKVKSSGYSLGPRMSMIGSKVQHYPAKDGRKQEGTGLRSVSYPTTSSPTSHLQHSSRVSDRPSPLYTASFSGSGRDLVFGCADHSIYRTKVLPTSDKVTVFLGHNGSICSTYWSHSEQWLISGSADKTARLWAASTSAATAAATRAALSSREHTPVLVLNTLRHNLKHQEQTHVMEVGNETFKREISFAQFYYLDKFLLLASGNSSHLYKYYIDRRPLDDIRRYSTMSRYKLVTSLSMESAQSVTSLSAINDFHSYIVLVGGSNKSLEIYDMNEGKCARIIPDVHSRAVHCICQNKGSKFITHAAESYDIFATSAVTDGIKLWDLRSNRCVHHYTSHVNQSQPTVIASFSPCARYLASGSEDNSAYIYDLRCSSPLHILTGHSDTVTATAYHPQRPLLVTTTLDGQVSYFTDTAIK